MSDADEAFQNVFAVLQSHTLTRSPTLPSSAKALLKEVRSVLLKASDEDVLTDAPHDIFPRLKLSEPSDGYIELTGGDLNFKRTRSLSHFTRDDGAWFDFHMTVRERGRNKPIELVAYGFEIRFTSGAAHGPRWIRFDFNTPDHPNEERGMRSHFHPSTDDWSIPAPLMSPVEVLHLFVHRLRAHDPGRLRSTSAVDGDDLPSGDELPRVHNPLPGPRAGALVELLARFECPGLTARRRRREELSGASHDPIVWTAARGANVLDADGNLYVDMTAGFGAALIGHTHPRVVEAVQTQSARMLHALGDVYPSDVKVALEARLAGMAPWPARVILGLSGADAVEAALKTAALHTKRPGVLAFEGGYHGLSYGTVAACGYKRAFREPFARQLNAEVRFAQYPDRDVSGSFEASLGAVEAVLARGDVGAVLVEPVQGRGGVVVPPEGFLAALGERARAAGALLVVDEIYTGLYRTGERFRSVSDGCVPDVVCFGKALGGGVPVSACLMRDEVARAWGTSEGEAIHTSTFLGNPLACAAAMAALDVLEEPATQRSIADAGAHLANALDALAGDPSLSITRVTHVGLLAGVTVAGGVARSLAAMRAMLERGYVVLPGGVAGDVLTLTPPCTVTREQVEGFTGALAASLREVLP